LLAQITGEIMGFEKHADETLDEKIAVRLTREEKGKLAEDAYLAGLSMSALVRARYFGRPIIANTDQIMVRELRRIGGLLKHIHNESNGIYSKETAQILTELNAFISSIGAKK
jgi:hypothetical protein